jgi:hypothetical protein
VKKPPSVIIGLVILVICVIGKMFDIINQGLSLSSFLGILLLLCCIIGFWKRSNIGRIGYFILMNSVFFVVISGLISMRQSPAETIVYLIPWLLFTSNSWFVMFGRKSKAYFAKVVEVQTAES